MPYQAPAGAPPLDAPVPIWRLPGAPGTRVEDRSLAPGPMADFPTELPEQLDRTAHGQAVTSRALRRLRTRGWMHLDDLHWPGRPRAVIDHVAVGPGGIIVVITVHWVGTVDVHAGQIYRNGRPSAAQRTCEAAADAVRSVLPVNLHRSVVPALSIVTDQPIDALAGNVLVCATAQLESVLERRPRALTDKQVARTAALLWGTLSVGAGRKPRPSGSSRRANQVPGWWRAHLGSRAERNCQAPT